MAFSLPISLMCVELQRLLKEMVERDKLLNEKIKTLVEALYATYPDLPKAFDDRRESKKGLN